MKITCPNNPNHKRFEVSVHETHLWMVDEEGNWLATLDMLQVAKYPGSDDHYICVECGNEENYDVSGIVS